MLLRHGWCLEQSRETERRNNEKSLLVNMCILLGIFKDETAAYTTLLQFSEFYRTTGNVFQFEQAENVLELTE